MAIRRRSDGLTKNCLKDYVAPRRFNRRTEDFMELTRREFTALVPGALAGLALPRFGVAAAADGPGDAALTALTLAEASAKIRSGAATSVQLTEACLARVSIYDSKLDAFITVLKEQALAQARALDAEMKARKWRGPLHGIPIALKDNIDTAGTRTTAGSAVFEDRIPTEDAPVVSRLKTAGAVIIGKTNLQEFAMGAGETSYFGPARNPWSLAHSTGGSSSGSGAAIVAELCFGSLGTDTAGSVRIPASFCGIVGLKPTYGLVPIRGIVPLILSLDHCGPMTRTVEDTALLLNVIAGFDKLDSTSIERPMEDYAAALGQPVSGFRLGIPAYFYDHLDTEVAGAVQEALRVLAKLTRSTKDVALPAFTNVSNVALGAGETYAYHEEFFKRAPQRYLSPQRRRLEALSKSTMTAADYVRAKWSLELLRRTVNDAFADVDALVVPTMRILPPPLSDLIKAAREGTVGAPAEMIANTQPLNLYGIPAVTVPCGFSQSGLPIGLTFAGPHFSEGRILALARAFEQATDWHKRRPLLSPTMPVPSVAGPA
jgi:aspartyl-tRNA(Asn)/glutamyl-tRNA(Gln) amidotransferase subunit A